MSFDLYVLSAEVPTRDPGEFIELLEAQADRDGELVPQLREVVEALEAEWPSWEEDMDHSPWATQPLEQPECEGRVLALNIRWPYVESAVPGIERICAERGLHVYDPQLDVIAIPGAAGPRRGLLRRLFRRT